MSALIQAWFDMCDHGHLLFGDKVTSVFDLIFPESKDPLKILSVLLSEPRILDVLHEFVKDVESSGGSNTFWWLSKLADNPATTREAFGKILALGWQDSACSIFVGNWVTKVLTDEREPATPRQRFMVQPAAAFLSTMYAQLAHEEA